MTAFADAVVSASVALGRAAGLGLTALAFVESTGLVIYNPLGAAPAIDMTMVPAAGGFIT